MIKYKFSDPPLSGAICPNCGKKSWDIFECEECGAVFCKYCRPDLVKFSKDDDNYGTIFVSCDCGSKGLFV